MDTCQATQDSQLSDLAGGPRLWRCSADACDTSGAVAYVRAARVRWP